MAGVCLIRLKHLRLRSVPQVLGLGSENAAHRIAVTWEQGGKLREGVSVVPRRDTSSRFNALAGSQLFPGIHHHARFESHEQHGRYRVGLDSDDGQAHLLVAGRVADKWPSGSIFPSLDAASTSRAGSLGYSAARQPGRFDGLELRCLSWAMMPLEVEQVESSFFDNRELFPQGSVQFDSALLMQEIDHECGMVARQFD